MIMGGLSRTPAQKPRHGAANLGLGFGVGLLVAGSLFFAQQLLLACCAPSEKTASDFCREVVGPSVSRSTRPRAERACPPPPDHGTLCCSPRFRAALLCHMS